MNEQPFDATFEAYVGQLVLAAHEWHSGAMPENVHRAIKDLRAYYRQRLTPLAGGIVLHCEVCAAPNFRHAEGCEFLVDYR